MMKILFVFLAITAVAVNGRYFDGFLVRTPAMDQIYDPRFRGRIVNGEPADISEFPHMLAFIDLTRGGFRCGASNIHPFWALSAAHCTDIGTPPSLINLRGGSTNRLSGGRLFFVQSYTNHPSYNRRTLEYDISVIRIRDDTPMRDFPHVSSIPLAPVCNNDNCCGVCEGGFVTTSGWGRNEHGVLPVDLQQLTKPIHERSDCNRIWTNIGPSFFCKMAFDGRDTCNGDSGSPVIIGSGSSSVQHGVVSFGTAVCGDGTAPSVNVRIEHSVVRNWITVMTGV